MPCDLPFDCFCCPKLKAYMDKRGPLDVAVYFCPIAAAGKPTDLRVVA
jgi:hypothetical protein